MIQQIRIVTGYLQAVLLLIASSLIGYNHLQKGNLQVANAFFGGGLIMFSVLMLANVRYQKRVQNVHAEFVSLYEKIHQLAKQGNK